MRLMAICKLPIATLGDARYWPLWGEKVSTVKIFVDWKIWLHKIKFAGINFCGTRK